MERQAARANRDCLKSFIPPCHRELPGNYHSLAITRNAIFRKPKNLRSERGHCVFDQLYGFADQVRDPGGKAGIFERLDRFHQGFTVSRCHFRSLFQRQNVPPSRSHFDDPMDSAGGGAMATELALERHRTSDIFYDSISAVPQTEMRWLCG
jgi:hypothetical protein